MDQTIRLGIIQNLIPHKYDPEDLIELLEITTEDLLEAFEDKVIKNMDKFLELIEEDIEEVDDI